MISHIKIMLKDNSNSELTIYGLFYDNTLCTCGEKMVVLRSVALMQTTVTCIWLQGALP